MVDRTELDRRGLRHFVVVDADITMADRADLERRGLRYQVQVDESGNSVVSGPPAAPVNTVLPVISGTPIVGQTISTTNGTWTASPSPTFTYQWKRAGANISGATASTYLLVALDTAALITVTVTATNASGSASATSASFGTITSVPANAVLPAITGTTLVGQTLTSSTGTWAGTPVPTYAYQWKNAGVAIGGATASTYLLQASDEGDLITVTVTATNSAGSASATSNSVGPITAGPPVLSAASAVDFSDIFVWGQATTDTASGTLYAVVVPGAATTPTAAQIIAGTDAAGAAAPNASVAITSTGAKQVLVRGLTAVTAYKVCMAHQAASGNSNVVTGAFTTDTLIGAYATNGTATGLSASTGSAAFGLNQADPHGGTNALRWTDINDAVTGQILMTVLSATYVSGNVKVHMTAKHVGGAQFIRIIPTSMTSLASVNFNPSTGAIGTETWVGTPVTFDVATGWKMFSGVIDLTGADVTGPWSINQCLTDNVISSPTRNGTNIKDIYNIRFTRV